MDCPKFGAVFKADARYCEMCGTTVDGKVFAPESTKQEHAYDMFKENNASVSENRTGGETICSPEFWMYVLSALFPVLQWILMGVYVQKNQFDDAKSLFFKPLIVQMIVYGVCVIILFLSLMYELF